MGLVKLYVGRDAAEAHFLRIMLEEQGIAATVLGEYLSTGWGYRPPRNCATQGTSPMCACDSRPGASWGGGLRRPCGPGQRSARPSPSLPPGPWRLMTLGRNRRRLGFLPLTRRATNLPPYGLGQQCTMSCRYDKSRLGHQSPY